MPTLSQSDNDNYDEFEEWKLPLPLNKKQLTKLLSKYIDFLQEEYDDYHMFNNRTSILQLILIGAINYFVERKSVKVLRKFLDLNNQDVPRTYYYLSILQTLVNETSSKTILQTVYSVAAKQLQLKPIKLSSKQPIQQMQRSTMGLLNEMEHDPEDTQATYDKLLNRMRKRAKTVHYVETLRIIIIDVIEYQIETSKEPIEYMLESIKDLFDLASKEDLVKLHAMMYSTHRELYDRYETGTDE